MKKLQTFLALILLTGIIQIGWLTPAYCSNGSSSSSDTPDRSPDRQRYNPVTPEQIIQKDQDRVKTYKAVPVPPKKGKRAKKAAKVQKEEE
jgi:hypothetical protein